MNKKIMIIPLLLILSLNTALAISPSDGVLWKLDKFFDKMKIAFATNKEEARAQVQQERVEEAQEMLKQGNPVYVEQALQEVDVIPDELDKEYRNRFTFNTQNMMQEFNKYSNQYSFIKEYAKNYSHVEVHLTGTFDEVHCVEFYEGVVTAVVDGETCISSDLIITAPQSTAVYAYNNKYNLGYYEAWKLYGDIETEPAEAKTQIRNQVQNMIKNQNQVQTQQQNKGGE